MYPADIWRRNFLVLVGFIIAGQIAQLVVLEFFPVAAGGGAVSVFVKENSDAKKRNDRLQERRTAKLADREKIGHEDSKEVIEHAKREINDGVYRKSFTWENLNYDVPIPGGSIRLLNNVNGYVKPGTLTALMGSSGAGKTTCLDVLAQRKNVGVITGDLFVDGRPLSSDFARGTAYGKLKIFLFCVTIV